MTAEELAKELFVVRSKIEAFKRTEADLEERLAAEMADKKLEVPMVGVFERRRKNDRKKWQHAEIQSALISKLRTEDLRDVRVDLETGEVIKEDDIAMTARIFAITANPSWRTTALKELNIDPDEHCVVVPSGYTIQIHADLDSDEVA